MTQSSVPLDYDLLEVDASRSNINGKRLFVIYGAFCSSKRCTILFKQTLYNQSIALIRIA